MESIRTSVYAYCLCMGEWDSSENDSNRIEWYLFDHQWKLHVQFWLCNCNGSLQSTVTVCCVEKTFWWTHLTYIVCMLLNIIRWHFMINLAIHNFDTDKWFWTVSMRFDNSLPTYPWHGESSLAKSPFIYLAIVVFSLVVRLLGCTVFPIERKQNVAEKEKKRTREKVMNAPEAERHVTFMSRRLECEYMYMSWHLWTDLDSVIHWET